MARSENKQLAINMIAQVGVALLTMCINFILTPFIVNRLGVEAYGFVGLSNSIIGYMQIVTIALNSMAGRYITIEYHKGDLKKANKYFSSVFFANCILGAVVFLLCFALVLFLEKVINIPDSLILDVKFLFLLLATNTVLLLVCNVFTVSPFIKNKLEINAIRNFISTFLRLFLVIALFLLFVPHIWYVGLASLLCSVYLVSANYLIKRKLTPELVVLRTDFDFQYIKQIISSGIWNLVNKLSVILEKGLDLLLANWFINTYIMGMVSIVAQITILIPQFIGLIGLSFAPSLTEYYAKNDIEGIQRNVFKSIRIMSIAVVAPLAIFYVYGDTFFSLWLPNQDSNLLYLVFILTTIDFIFGMPLEIFWSIFTATNRVKVPAITMCVVGVLTFTTLIGLLMIAKTSYIQLVCLASTRTIWNILKNILFMPIYGAKCLQLKWNYFYRSMTKPILGIIATLFLCVLCRFVYMPSTWITFILSACILTVLSISLSSIFVLNNCDRKYIFNTIKNKITH
jgi:O-antigen/teichoic acid export membrane protein